MTISLIIIYTIHQLWNHFINIYTEKKVNRVLDNEIDQYKEIIKHLSNTKTSYLNTQEEEEQDLETFLNTISNE